MLPFLLLLTLIGPSVSAHVPHIVNGIPVYDPTRWPWQGSLRGASDSHTCGCALISPTWAVTAAHCITEGHQSVNFGSVQWATPGQVRVVLQKIVHESYGTGSGLYPNDIAVIRFDDLTEDETTTPVRMTSKEQAGNDDCHISGWGYTDMRYSRNVDQLIPRTLHEAPINVYTQKKCKEDWGSWIDDGHVCVGDPDNHRGACNGDSGGPLVCRVDDTYRLVGVTSWGEAGCRTSSPSVYSRISKFRDWISEKTGI